MEQPVPAESPIRLACTVRGCAAPLVREARRWHCPRGHSFDVARAGHVNLLQPQDRRSLAAGDAADAVAARAELLGRGVGRALFDELRGVVRTLGLGARSTIVELGCGTGQLALDLVRDTAASVVGIDLATAAVAHAARATPPELAARTAWVVANADRRLPLPDGAADLALSVHARRNPGEVARVLAPGGHWLVAVPGELDLVELRAVLHGATSGRERGSALAAELAGFRGDAAQGPVFTPVGSGACRVRHAVTEEDLAALCRATYRGMRHAETTRLAAHGPGALTHVTLHSDWLLVRRA